MSAVVHRWLVLRAIPPALWKQFCESAAVVAGIAAAQGACLTPDPENYLRYNRAVVILDGYSEMRDFEFWRRPRGRKKNFGACSPERRPYEIVVMAILILAEHYATDYVTISSTGSAEGWQDGLELAQLVEPSAKMPMNLRSDEELVAAAVDYLEASGVGAGSIANSPPRRRKQLKAPPRRTQRP